MKNLNLKIWKMSWKKRVEERREVVVMVKSKERWGYSAAKFVDRKDERVGGEACCSGILPLTAAFWLIFFAFFCHDPACCPTLAEQTATWFSSLLLHLLIFEGQLLKTSIRTACIFVTLWCGLWNKLLECTTPWDIWPSIWLKTWAPSSALLAAYSRLSSLRHTASPSPSFSSLWANFLFRSLHPLTLCLTFSLSEAEEMASCLWAFDGADHFFSELSQLAHLLLALGLHLMQLGITCWPNYLQLVCKTPSSSRLLFCPITLDSCLLWCAEWITLPIFLCKPNLHA